MIDNETIDYGDEENGVNQQECQLEGLRSDRVYLKRTKTKIPINKIIMLIALIEVAVQGVFVLSVCNYPIHLIIWSSWAIVWFSLCQFVFGWGDKS